MSNPMQETFAKLERVAKILAAERVLETERKLLLEALRPVVLAQADYRLGVVPYSALGFQIQVKAEGLVTYDIDLVKRTLSSKQYEECLSFNKTNFEKFLKDHEEFKTALTPARMERVPTEKELKLEAALIKSPAAPRRYGRSPAIANAAPVAPAQVDKGLQEPAVAEPAPAPAASGHCQLELAA